MKRIDIKFKLLAVILIIMIPLTTLHILGINEKYNNSIEYELKQNQDMAEAVSTTLLNFLDTIWASELAMGVNIIEQKENPEKIQAHFNEMLRDQEAILNYYWTDSEGKLLLSSTQIEQYKISQDYDYIKRILNGEDKVISSFVINEDKNKGIIPVARGIRNQDGELLGIMIATIDADKLGLKLPKGNADKSRFGLIDNKGYMVYRSEGDYSPFEERVILKDLPSRLFLQEELVKSTKKFSGFNDKIQIGIANSINSIGWDCFVMSSLNRILIMRATEINRDIILVFLLSLLVYFLAFNLVNTNFLRPIRNLQKSILNTKAAASLDLNNESINDIAEHLRNTINSTDYHLKGILNNDNIGVLLETAEGVLVQTNQVFCNIVGYSEAELKKLKNAYYTYEEDLAKEKRYYQQLVDGEIDYFQMEKRYVRKDGIIIWADVMALAARAHDNKNDYIVFFIEDITERKMVQLEISKLEKLNIIGEMAAGISHEIRNPMTVVRGFLQMLQRKEDFQKFQEYFNLMISELDRANSIISEFLSISKPPVDNLESNNINKIVKSIAPLIETDTIRQDKKLVVEMEDIPDLFVDDKEIRQLILNLCRNGLEAMEKGGTLTIRTYQEEDLVVLAVADEGTGISPEIIEKIDTPFFTTKEKGTGLGLGICYGIAKRHNAKIDLDTGPGGTTFYVRFVTELTCTKTHAPIDGGCQSTAKLSQDSTNL